MRVRNASEYKKRIVELLEVRKERREKKKEELTQVQIFDSLDINDEVLDIALLDEIKEDRSRTQTKKKKVRK